MTAEQAFLAEIGNAYLANAPAPSEKALSQWRPTGIVWPLLRDMQGVAAGMRKRVATVDGQKFVWLEGGAARGTPVVLLHGFASSKENWLPLLPFLARRHRLFVLDLPGWGESSFHFGADYGIDDQAARVAQWLQAHVPGSAHIVGSSMGGAIAGMVAARYPDQVTSLTLMNAAGVRGVHASEFETGLLKGRNALVTHSVGDVFRLFTLATERNRHLLAALLSPVMGGQMLARRHVNTHLFHHLVGKPPEESLPGISAVSAPTLVLWGEQDRVLHVSCADTFQQLIPHAKVKRLRGIGHLPMVEAPAVTARNLQKFWRAHVQEAVQAA